MKEYHISNAFDCSILFSTFSVDKAFKLRRASLSSTSQTLIVPAIITADD